MHVWRGGWTQSAQVDPQLASVIGIYADTKAAVIGAVWEYIKVCSSSRCNLPDSAQSHRLQDAADREYFTSDPYLRAIFKQDRVKFSHIPRMLDALLTPCEPITIIHAIDPHVAYKRSVFDIEVELVRPVLRFATAVTRVNRTAGGS